ncbi:hypothetical protein [Lyngbya confervoides]|uniref:Uncharacterized protein n=1 Tax=Lyngbya confervoides BDU141951 TaxID=1574623 RepID=A0ABD4T9C5_9CYAN|nr:hypothetical protein [Lyngbya confervoides]MCM1985065.1 hypothetical protein [Lyngbya confervoides BDU141951]
MSKQFVLRPWWQSTLTLLWISGFGLLALSSSPLLRRPLTRLVRSWIRLDAPASSSSTRARGSDDILRRPPSVPLTPLSDEQMERSRMTLIQDGGLSPLEAEVLLPTP